MAGNKGFEASGGYGARRTRGRKSRLTKLPRRYLPHRASLYKVARGQPCPVAGQRRGLIVRDVNVSYCDVPADRAEHRAGGSK